MLFRMSRSVVGIKGLLMAEDAVDDPEEFSRAGGERSLFVFASGNEVLMEAL